MVHDMTAYNDVLILYLQFTYYPSTACYALLIIRNKKIVCVLRKKSGYYLCSLQTSVAGVVVFSGRFSFTASVPTKIKRFYCICSCEYTIISYIILVGDEYNNNNNTCSVQINYALLLK